MTTPKERPIIFSGPMVRAILEGRKTQTRRIVKRSGDMEFDPADPHFGPYWLSYATEVEGEDAKVHCPYGKPGDLLWVRETFCIESSREVAYEPPHSDGRPIKHHQGDAWGPWWEQPHYRATDAAPELEIGADEPGCKWRPSIHMPRWASRITLEITGIRVERLQQISEADAVAEGCPLVNPDPFIPGHGASSASGWFSDLWEQINGAGSWDANPWVWVVEFQRQEAQP